MPDTHVFEFQQDFLKDGYIPWCSCGWSGREVETIEDAQEAWDNHCDVVFMEATGG